MRRLLTDRKCILNELEILMYQFINENHVFDIHNQSKNKSSNSIQYSKLPIVEAIQDQYSKFIERYVKISLFILNHVV